MEMPASTGQTPFHHLLELERISKSKTQDFPNQGNIREKWSGISFELRDQTLLVPMKSVSEVMLPPVVTRIPGAKPWVLGVANKRGNLLPVMGLKRLLFGSAESSYDARQRVIVIQHPEIAAGLLVDSVMGLKHFWVDEQSESIPSMDTEIRLYVTHSYQRDEAYYPVFSLERLVESDLFKNIVE